MNPSDPASTYDAFISYRRTDSAFAAKLEQALERYKPPRELVAESRHLRIFRDTEDFTGTDYPRALAAHLGEARKLILLCSPAATQSPYVNDEIQRFVEMRGADHVIPLIIAGKPNNEVLEGDKEAAFPEALMRALEMPLAADFREFDTKKGKLKAPPFREGWYTLLANLLGTTRSEIERRELLRERRRRWIMASSAGTIIAALTALSIFAFSQKRIAERETDRAELSEGAALDSAEVANEQRAIAAFAAQAATDSAIVAQEQRREAQRQRGVAEAQALVATGEAGYEEEPLPALLTALEGFARIPPGEAPLETSLNSRVAALARNARVGKLSDDVVEIFPGRPDFPYLFVRNRYAASTLYRLSDLSRVRDFDGINSTQPIRIHVSGKYFVVAHEGGNGPTFGTRYSIFSVASGAEIGYTEILNPFTLFPVEDPKFLYRFTGISPWLNRLSDGRSLRPEGFDISTLIYRQGATRFALRYRDDENSRIPPSPGLFDANTGELLEVLPRFSGLVLPESDTPFYVWSDGQQSQLRSHDPQGMVIAELGPDLQNGLFDRSGEFLLIELPDSTEIRRASDGQSLMRVAGNPDTMITLPGRASWKVWWSAGDAEELRLSEGQLRRTPSSAAPLPVFSAFRPLPPWDADPTGVDETSDPSAGVVFVRDSIDDDDEHHSSELVRTLGDSVIFRTRDEIGSDHVDPGQNYVAFTTSDPDDDDAAGFVLRIDDGERIWQSSGRASVRFPPAVNAAYFLVEYRGRQGRRVPVSEIIRLPDGEQIERMSGALRDVDFLSLEELGLFLVDFRDGRSEIWDGREAPLRLLDLGFGVSGHLPLPGELLLVWYDSGEAYVLDVNWLRSMGGSADTMSPEMLANTLCRVAFESPLFDRSSWRETRFEGPPRACRE